MKAHVLVDNIENEELSGEWGLSIYIEYKNKKILLDTGASGLFAKNAEKMGIDLEHIDFAVLSHAHYDHGDGMPTFFEINVHAPFYLQDVCDENCYSGRGDKYLGIPKGILATNAARIIRVNGNHKIDDGIYLVPHKSGNLSAIGERENMYVYRQGRFEPDDFAHEQSLVFQTENGLVIFNSCSHGGAHRIIKEVAETFPGQQIFAMIGGFHLYNKTEEEIRQFGEKVKETEIKLLYTGHCTGEKAYDILKEILGDKLNQFHCGLIMQF